MHGPRAYPPQMQVPASARLTIDLDAVVANWRTVSAHAAVQAGAALKANGYGLGAAPIARRLVAEGCRDVFVATWAEALALGDAADGAIVHVLHGVEQTDLPATQALPHAQPVLNSREQVDLWRAAAPQRPCDLMIDCGMNRLGLDPLNIVLTTGLNTDILMSHMSCADEPTHPANTRTRDTFATIPHPARRRSLAASAGAYLGPAYGFDLIRPGIALYGGQPCAAATDIAQVAHIHARILQLRDLAPGDPVGYGQTFTATRPTRLGLVGLGYADGLPRVPGAKALLDGTEHPVVGRVSMDLTAIDLTDAPAVHLGDWLEIAFDLPALAATSGRSQYELLTGLGHRFERDYTRA